MSVLARTVLAGFFCAAACLTAHAETASQAGERLFEEHCAGCHGERLSNPNNLFDLRQLGKDERARFDKAVREGKGQMPAWEGTLSDRQFDEVWSYIRSMAD